MKFEYNIDVIDSKNDVAIVDVVTLLNGEVFDVDVRIKIGNCLCGKCNVDGLQAVKRENKRCYADAMEIVKRKKLCIEW